MVNPKACVDRPGATGLGAGDASTRIRSRETMKPFDVPPESRSVAQAIHEHARERPDAPAILAPGRTALTYAGLWRQIDRTVG
jgi:hypothetical protein